MKKSVLLLSVIIIRNILFSQAGDIPTNLQIDAASVGGVTLSWDIPENYRKEWMSHSTFAFVYGIGNQGLDPANYFHKFPDSLLAEYHNMLVTEIAFFPALVNFIWFSLFSIRSLNHIFSTGSEICIYSTPRVEQYIFLKNERISLIVA